MKRFLAIALLFSTTHCLAQANPHNSYLLVRFENYHDYINGNNYFTISAEDGSDSATDIYSLLHYNNRKDDKNSEGAFFASKKSSDSTLFNYFFTTTEALNYLSRIGWTLMTIYPEMGSYYDDRPTSAGYSIPITTIGSTPVFCFRK